MSVFEGVKENLLGRGYIVNEFSTIQEAARYLDSQIDQCTVGFGGSGTLLSAGVYEMLESHNSVHWHWKSDDKNGERLISMTADVYLTSVNALTQAGEMVNIDGAGNRISAMLYGHKKVYYVIGKNKLVENLDAAIDRVRNYCGPQRSAALGMKTPCVVDMKCHDCRSPQRICNAMNILLCPMMGMAAEVLLVDEELGS